MINSCPNPAKNEQGRALFRSQNDLKNVFVSLIVVGFFAFFGGPVITAVIVIVVIRGRAAGYDFIKQAKIECFFRAHKAVAFDGFLND